jgi:hypothetical protein
MDDDAGTTGYLCIIQYITLYSLAAVTYVFHNIKILSVACLRQFLYDISLYVDFEFFKILKKKTTSLKIFHLETMQRGELKF